MLGQALYTYGTIWLLLSSIILLLSMVSALFLSKNLSKNSLVSANKNFVISRVNKQIKFKNKSFIAFGGRAFHTRN